MKNDFTHHLSKLKDYGQSRRKTMCNYNTHVRTICFIKLEDASGYSVYNKLKPIVQLEVKIKSELFEKSLSRH